MIRGAAALVGGGGGGRPTMARAGGKQPRLPEALAEAERLLAEAERLVRSSCSSRAGPIARRLAT